MYGFVGIFVLILMGVVYMGVFIYVGNVLNFMVSSIVIESGIVMFSFFGYLLWVGVVLILLFLLLMFLFVVLILCWY